MVRFNRRVVNIENSQEQNKEVVHHQDLKESIKLTEDVDLSGFYAKENVNNAENQVKITDDDLCTIDENNIVSHFQDEIAKAEEKEVIIVNEDEMKNKKETNFMSLKNTLHNLNQRNLKYVEELEAELIKKVSEENITSYEVTIPNKVDKFILKYLADNEISVKELNREGETTSYLLSW